MLDAKTPKLSIEPRNKYPLEIYNKPQSLFKMAIAFGSNYSICEYFQACIIFLNIAYSCFLVRNSTVYYFQK